MWASFFSALAAVPAFRDMLIALIQVAREVETKHNEAEAAKRLQDKDKAVDDFYKPRPVLPPANGVQSAPAIEQRGPTDAGGPASGM